MEAIQVWDAQKGAESGKVELLESVLPHERKELALALFHENNYKLNGKRDTFEALDIEYISTFLINDYCFAKSSLGILEKVMITPRPLNISPATTKRFTRSIIKGTKNFRVVSKRTRKTAGDCQAFYYSNFKRTCEYFQLKRTQSRKKT